MSDLKDFFRDFGYFSVGAAAVIIETGSKAVNALVKKGKKTLSDNQDTVDEIKRKAKAAGERLKDAVEKATSAPEDDPTTPDAIYHTDEPIPEEPEVVEPEVAEPVIEVPEVTEPVTEDPEGTQRPEDTVNG